MPLYDARRGWDRSEPYARPRSEPFPEGDVYDARGEVVPYVLWCDTDTGDVERYVRDADGTWQMNRDHTVRTVVERRPAPLSLGCPAPLLVPAGG